MYRSQFESEYDWWRWKHSANHSSGTSRRDDDLYDRWRGEHPSNHSDCPSRRDDEFDDRRWRQHPAEHAGGPSWKDVEVPIGLHRDEDLLQADGVAINDGAVDDARPRVSFGRESCRRVATQLSSVAEVIAKQDTDEQDQEKDSEEYGDGRPREARVAEEFEEVCELRRG